MGSSRARHHEMDVSMGPVLGGGTRERRESEWWTYIGQRVSDGYLTTRRPESDWKRVGVDSFTGRGRVCNSWWRLRFATKCGERGLPYVASSTGTGKPPLAELRQYWISLRTAGALMA